MGLENRIVYDLVDVIEGRCRLRQAMIKDKRQPDLYLIPAAQTRDRMAVSPSDMILVCDELKQEMDYIIIDSPAGIERVITSYSIHYTKLYEFICNLVFPDEGTVCRSVLGML